MRNNIIKAGMGLGLLLLTSAPLEAQKSKSYYLNKAKNDNYCFQKNPSIVKAGIAYNIVRTDEFSKNCLGIEVLLETKLKERLFTELEIGFYLDTCAISSLYSKMQTNMGLEYKPIMKGGWAMGGKLALGVSSEFYRRVEGERPIERVYLNKLVGLDVEKIFKNGAGINVGVSKEIDRNIWRIGIKGILKPESRKYNNYPRNPKSLKNIKF